MTRAMYTRLLGGFLLAWAVAWPVRAAEETTSAQPYVILVGISEYQQDKQINTRPHAEDDVKALYDLLTDKQYLGVDADHVRLLLGKEDKARHSQPATKANILKALEWARDKAGVNDPVIFAFIGQGGSLGERGDRLCYFASDSTLKGRDKDAVASAQIGEILDKLKSQRFCALLDVNFKGFTSKEQIPEASLGNAPYREFLGDDGTEEHGAVPGRMVFLATNGLDESINLKDMGLFAKVVVDALKGKADKEGKEKDGLVTVDELTEYLRTELPELARQHGKTREEKEQTPFVLGSRANHFPLTRNPEMTAKVEERLKKLDELAKAGKLTKEEAAEGRELLSRMPRLEVQRELRKAYQALVEEQISKEKFDAERASLMEKRKLSRQTAVAFAQKVIDAMQMIREGYVKDVKQGDLINWAVRGLYRRVEEKVPPDIAERLDKADRMSETELAKLLADVRQGLGNREDLGDHKDLDIALQRMTSKLDPYTTYIDPETAKRLDSDIRGSFTGIGIQIRKDSLTDMLQVVTPIKGSPAFREGLQAGDLITTIKRNVDSDGKPLAKEEVLSTKGLPLNDAVKKILGKPGTKVTLVIQREGEDKPIEKTITRGRVEVESVLGYKRKSDAEWDYYVDPENKIGYVRLTSFARNTFRDLKAVVEKMSQDGLKGFVLDLRFNPGGLLNSAVDVSDLFVDDGKIVSIRPRVGRESVIPGKSEGSFLGFPMVCLVNGGSASGSEIVAACLQDHYRAVIVGERSYGKGSVQNIQPFEGGEIKLTTASFYGPKGRNLNKSSTTGKDDEDWGVRPDKGFLVELSRKEREDLFEHQRNAEIIPKPEKPGEKSKPEFKDVQLEKALDYLRAKIKTAARVPAAKAG